MKTSTWMTVGGAAAGLAGGVAGTLLLRRVRRSRLRAGLDRMQAHFASLESARFEEILPGVRRALLWGNPDRGPYAAFTRLEPNHRNPLHTHTHDISVVVLDGAYIYEVDGQATRVEARSHVFIPGGAPHVSYADRDAGCVFFRPRRAVST